MGKEKKKKEVVEKKEIDLQEQKTLEDDAEIIDLEKIDAEEAQEVFLIVKIAHTLYAFQSASVKEILYNPRIDPLPFMPPYIAGLINRHGEPFVLFNPHVLLENENTVKNIVIIIDSEEKFGIQVSGVETFFLGKISELTYDSMFRSSFFSFSIPFNEHEISVINPFSFLELLNKEIKNT